MTDKRLKENSLETNLENRLKITQQNPFQEIYITCVQKTVYIPLIEEGHCTERKSKRIP